ncbi:PAS domain-containing hybrid sensor histidine kinase/response regulator [Desulfonema magnum]|nr:PAS domain-containing sensor histidine kinase [Desulfonema magnum]
MTNKPTYKELEQRVKELEQALKQIKTEHKQSEKSLRFSNARFRNLFENAAFGIIICRLIKDEKGRAIDFEHLQVNAATRRHTGFNPETLVGKRALEVAAIEDIANIIKIYGQVVATGKPYEYEQHFTIYDRTLQVGAFPIEDDLFALTFIDITKRKHSEKALRESELRFRSTFEQAAVGICHTNPSGKFVRLNKRFSDIVGYSKNEIFLLTWQDITHPDDLEADLEYVKQVVNNEIQTYSMEKRFIRKDNSIVWVNLTVSLVRGNTGEPQYFIGVIEDIDYRKKMEEQLRQNQKMEAIGVLAGGIAHDFNNLLGVISGNVSFALSQLNYSKELFEALEDVQEGTKQAQNLTQQLLTFAKGGEPIKRTANLNHLIIESAKFVTRGAKSKCEFSLANDLWAVEIDSGQINQVISNLIINASQAMPDGGRIKIRTENTEIEADNNLTQQADRFIKVTVEDQGIGISEKHLKKIFEPFFSTKQKGSGLGLATSYSIIKKHGGHITVYSELDKGTAFHIYLPASSDIYKEIKENKDHSHHGQGKILIMDDQEPILEMLGRLLNQMGYETAFSTDGVQAVEMYQKAYQSQHPYDLIILDLTVPGGMGGAETILELLKIDPKVKAIVSSGYSNDPIMANYNEYGFCGVIAKPYTKSQLTQLLNKIFQEEH